MPATPTASAIPETANNSPAASPPCAVALAQAAFNYKVVCEDGAYVRAGLELSSRHLYTMQSQSVVEVMERCVNNQGLARLRTADGWISEMLNPLSGQRGPIVEPMPLEHLLKFRVIFPGGALVRSGVELSSSVVGTIPCGQIIVITEKRYSNTPSYRCVPRLKLADGSGWISMRINSPPPEDAQVVELLGLAQEGEVRDYSTALLGPPLAHGAGLVEGDGYNHYHGFEDSDEEEEEESEDEENNEQRRNEEELWHHPDGSRIEQHQSPPHKPPRPYEQKPEKIVVTDVPKPKLRKSQIKKGKKEDHTCLVCFSAPRNATFVHGETGHIACCLECSRVLKGRGDPCPVCRLPVDTVIQQFWA